jgi:hypothetical protein
MLAPTFTAIVLSASQPCDPLSHGTFVGRCVGSAVGASLVGSKVGSKVGAAVGDTLVGSAVGLDVGSAVGASVGAPVEVQLASSNGLAAKPSRHAHTHWSPSFTAIVVVKSHPCVPSSQARLVGMCVGDNVGAIVVGASVGSSVGLGVGAMVVGANVGIEVGHLVGRSVGDLVDLHLLGYTGSLTYPSRHWHVHSTPFLTGIVVRRSQWFDKSSQG